MVTHPLRSPRFRHPARRVITHRQHPMSIGCDRSPKSPNLLGLRITAIQYVASGVFWSMKVGHTPRTRVHGCSLDSRLIREHANIHPASAMSGLMQPHLKGDLGRATGLLYDGDYLHIKISTGIVKNETVTGTQIEIANRTRSSIKSRDLERCRGDLVQDRNQL
ncbi:hypothetical protein EVAR_91692_1 [Eumeta japonica]|uniref:Uncharacterized protein n=1 Tax=Eumeta variegata TaxID=151549 RepID=A0A4C1ZES8_EUMVA|nr:hypothetical protein EVAR_91692_1 [Eumeta japonica]